MGGQLPLSILRMSLAIIITAGLVGVVPQDVAARTEWRRVDNLNSERMFHTSTLLRDGRVLVTGGLDQSFVAQASAELFNPSTNQWSSARDMPDGRSRHSATLLNDGTVLVAGGCDTNCNLPKTVSLYDPVSNTWTYVADMPYGQSDHEAVRLNDGSVLLIGGVIGGGASLRSTLRYDPIVDAWSDAGEMSTYRYGFVAVVLGDGRVLVAGGDSGGSIATASVDIYDPATNSWQPGPALNSARAAHAGSLLKDGRVLVAGGYTGNVAPIASYETFDPIANTWSATQEPLSEGMTFGRAVRLADGAVLFGPGGRNPSSWLLVPGVSATGNVSRWIETGTFSPHRRAYAMTVLRDGSVLATGGVDDQQSGLVLADAHRYPPNSPPVVEGTTQWLRLGVLQPTTIPVSMAWQSFDTDGFAVHTVRQSVNGAAYTQFGVYDGRSLSGIYQASAGSTYQFSVRSTDIRGLNSPFTAGSTVKVNAIQESGASISYTGSWTVHVNAPFFGGRVRHTSSSAARAALTFTGTSVGWVTSRGPGRGIAEVWLDGVRVARIDLYAPTSRVRQLVYAGNGLAAGQHILEIRPAGKNPTATSARVDIDAFVILR